MPGQPYTNHASAPRTAPEARVTGRRILATAADAVLLSILLSMAVDGAAGLLRAAGGSETITALGALLASAGLPFAYYTGLEGRWGRTVGKGLLGIKVVREDTGEAPGTGAAALRTLLRLVDGLLFYLVALAFVLSSPRRRRLGDMVAGTLVVRDPRMSSVVETGRHAVACHDDYYGVETDAAGCAPDSGGWESGGDDCGSGSGD